MPHAMHSVQNWVIYGDSDEGQYEMGANSVSQAIKVLKQAGRASNNLDVKAVGHGNGPAEQWGIRLTNNGKAYVTDPKGNVVYKEGKEMSNFKTIAASLMSGKLKNVELPTNRVNHRRLTVDEIKAHIKEEFGKAQDVAKVKADEVDGWGDAEIAKEIEWVKALDLKEFFERK